MESGIYISDNKNDTYVIFGGRIGLAVGKRTVKGNEYKCLGAQTLDKTYNVGESIKEKWNYSKPSVHLLFDNEKSIDAIIESLDKLKDKFNETE